MSVYARQVKEKGYERVKLCHLPLVLPILIAFCWEQTSNDPKGLERQRLLARKAIFYLTEALLMRDPSITADAFAMAALLTKHLKDKKGNNRK